MSDDKPPPIELENFHITAKPDVPHPDGKPGGASGWTIGFGSGGGSGFFSGGFGGSRRKKAKRPGRAKKHAAAQQRAAAEAKARAQAEALAQAQREAAHKQLIQTLSLAFAAQRFEVDQTYAARSSALTQAVEAELRAARQPHKAPVTERWHLYIISKQTGEINSLVASKKVELQARSSQALSFNGNDPFVLDAAAYQEHLTLHSNVDSALALQIQAQWQDSYAAAHEARLLGQSVRLLEEKAQALSAYYVEQQQRWLAIEASIKKQQAQADERTEQINLKVRADEQTRRASIAAIHSMHAAYSSVSAGAVVWAAGGTAVAPGAAAALEARIGAGLKELARVAALRAGQTLSVSLSALLYSAPLGDGELTPEQRRRGFQGIGVRAEALGLGQDANLPAIAAAHGSVALATRIKALPVGQGTELRGVSTGGAVTAQVPVIMAALDPSTSTYRAATSGQLPRQLAIGAVQTGAVSAVPVRLYLGDTAIAQVPTGVDIRINDCVVCFPPEAGLEPQYFSFATAAPSAGVSVGDGQAASAQWWLQAGQAVGVALPAELSERLRYRQFGSVEAFDRFVWRTIAEAPQLGAQFDELNRKRISRGFAPYAPKASWVGERRTFEIRNSQAANDSAGLFDLDQLSIVRPDSDQGLARLTPTVIPWPVTGGKTWTPLLPPGSESLGPTERPPAPGGPAVYPGATTDPAGIGIETLPSADPDDSKATIPGYGDDDDLPSPDLVFVGPPVEPLEVGEYKDSSRRSRKDGLDIDHIVSRAALRKHIVKQYPNIFPRLLFAHLDRAPSIAIPARVHREFSETYGGRNTELKQNQDADDLRGAVDSNVDALKPGLLEEGFSGEEIESAREALHELNKQQGWYQ